jgi:hypothetical protein
MPSPYKRHVQVIDISADEQLAQQHGGSAPSLFVLNAHGAPQPLKFQSARQPADALAKRLQEDIARACADSQK